MMRHALSKVLGFIAVLASTINLVSGYLITDRMLKMFKKRVGRSHPMMEIILPLLYLLAAAGFILALKWMSSPATARRGVFAGEIGMLLAVIGTLLRFEVVEYQWILIAFFIGSAIGVPLAYLMPMTAVPQRTAHLARVRRSCVRADWNSRVLPAHSGNDHDGRPDAGNSARIPHVYGQSDGVRQACRRFCRRGRLPLPRPEYRQLARVCVRGVRSGLR